MPAAVPDFQPQRRSLPAYAQHHATLGIAERIGQEVLQHPSQQAYVTVHAQLAAVHSQGDALLAGERREFGAQRVEQRRQRERIAIRSDSAASVREMSSRSVIRSRPNAASCPDAGSAPAPPGQCALLCDSAAENSRAALSGCIRSWLTAARKRVFDWLAVSAVLLASISARLSCDSSRVRSLTRCSSPRWRRLSARVRPRGRR